VKTLDSIYHHDAEETSTWNSWLFEGSVDLFCPCPCTTYSSAKIHALIWTSDSLQSPCLQF